MGIARRINGKAYELIRAFKYKRDAERLAKKLRKEGSNVRIVHQKQYVNLRGEEKWFYGVFARTKR